MKVCMLTGLNKIGAFINFKNAGGMGTQVPLLAEKLRERGIDVDVDGEGEYDIYHVHNPMPNYIPLMKKARRRGAKIIVHARHLPELVRGGFKFGNAIYPFFHVYSIFFYSRADAVICATPYVKKWMEKNGIKTKLYLIPNGVDCSFFYPSEELRKKFREEHGIGNETVVFSVGLMIPRKGIHDFVEVARRCDDMKFIWIGSTERGLEKVNIEMPSNMIHIPFIPFKEMPSAYNGGDIFFFPTYAESYGNVLMEAAACGKPLVMRDIEIYEEWFIHGENCMKGRNVDDFVRILEEMKEKKLRGRLGKKAREIVMSQDISKTIDKLVRMYEELIERR